MKFKIILLLISVFFSYDFNAQFITGNLSLLSNQQIKLEGFTGLKTYAISNATADENGNFKLTYSQSDYGVGYLMSADEKPLFVILSGEDIEIIGFFNSIFLIGNTSASGNSFSTVCLDILYLITFLHE